MPHPGPDRTLLVVSWRARVENAKASYKSAVAQSRRLSEEYRTQEVPRADSGFALRHAIAVENEARSRYIDVLRIFTDLIVSGTLPPED
jgi:hypothetical protein